MNLPEVCYVLLRTLLGKYPQNLLMASLDRFSVVGPKLVSGGHLTCGAGDSRDVSLQDFMNIAILQEAILWDNLS